MGRQASWPEQEPGWRPVSRSQLQQDEEKTRRVNALWMTRTLAGGVRQSRHLKHTVHNQAQARGGPLDPGPQIAGPEQAARHRPVATTTGPGPEPLPLLPTLNSSPLPALSWCSHRGSSRRPDHRAQETRKADSGTHLAGPGRLSGAGGATQQSGSAPLESHSYPTAGLRRASNL